MNGDAGTIVTLGFKRPTSAMIERVMLRRKAPQAKTGTDSRSLRSRGHVFGCQRVGKWSFVCGVLPVAVVVCHALWGCGYCVHGCCLSGLLGVVSGRVAFP
eukprot:1232423-Rhodomonas_salina.1